MKKPEHMTSAQHQKCRRLAKQFWKHFYSLFSPDTEGTFEYKVSLLLRPIDGRSEVQIYELFEECLKHSSNPFIKNVVAEMKRQRDYPM